MLTSTFKDILLVLTALYQPPESLLSLSYVVRLGQRPWCTFIPTLACVVKTSVDQLLAISYEGLLKELSTDSKASYLGQ